MACPVCGNREYTPRPVWQALALTALVITLILGCLVGIYRLADLFYPVI